MSEPSEEITVPATSFWQRPNAAVAIASAGVLALGLVVLKNGVDIEPGALEAELVAMVRGEIGAVASFKRAVVVARLPKTRSGKVLRATMRAIADGRDFAVPSTIDDPTVLDEIGGALGRP